MVDARRPRWREALEVAATVSIIITCGVVVATLVTGGSRDAGAAPNPTPPAVRPPQPLPTEPIDVSGLAATGSPDAPVVIVEVSDFQCPFCARFYETTLPALMDRYIDTGRAQLAFHHLALESIHPQALKAAEASECARAQGRFWEMHDLLFENQRMLDLASLVDRAERLGLDMPRFEACLDGQMTKRVREQAAAAAALGIRGTPGFLVGIRTTDGRLQVRQRLSGVQTIEALAAVIDGLLAVEE